MAARLVIRLSAAAAAGIAVVGMAGPAVAAQAPVSAAQNPYDTPGCVGLDADQLQYGSLNYRNSEVEPQVAIDPTNDQHLVAAWQQDRWNDGGAHGLVAGYSTDGGATWTESPQPFSACYALSGGTGPYLDYQRASDAWVSIGPGQPGSDSSGSTVYSVSLSFDETPYKSDTNARRSAIGAATSYDGGATWTNVQPIIADPCESGTVNQPGYVCNNPKSFILNDKESVTADPTQPGVAYVVWDRLVAPPASPIGAQRERAYFGPAFFSMTTDYGQTWSQPRIIVGLSSQDQTIGNQIVVDPRNGTLYDFFNLIQNASNRQQHRGENVAFVTSTDGGTTWSKPHVVSSLQAGVVADPNNVDPTTNTAPAPSRTGDDLPEPAIDPATGQLYVVWQDSRFPDDGGSAVVISTSSDGGATWSAPAQVNDSTGQPAYDPAVYVGGPHGAVGVSYLQWGETVAGNEPTTLYIRHSTSPGSSTAAPAFDGPTALSQAFNNLAAPFALGYFLGDYQGMVANTGGFVPVYVTTTCGDGGPSAEPSCRALTSVLKPADPTPTDKNSTDVYAFPGS